MAGFPLSGGYKKGHAMYMMLLEEKKPTVLPIDEVKSSVISRTYKMTNIISFMCGYWAEIRKAIDDWLKTHVA